MAAMLDLADYRPLLPLLACPDCRSGLADQTSHFACVACNRRFAVDDAGVLPLLPSRPKPEPPIYDDADFKKFRALYDADAENVYYSERNGLFRWIHHSAHQRTHRYWGQFAGAGWVADLGCGTGDHFGYFESLDRVVGVDMSHGSLLASRRRFPGVRLLQADANFLPFLNGSLSAVFSIYNLEHLYYLMDALAEIARVLEPRGRLLVGLPTEGGFAWSLGRRLSMNRSYSTKYGVDYNRVMQIEHCNTASAVMKACRRLFTQRRRHFFPLPMLPHVHPNLTIAAEFVKPPEHE